MGTADSHEHAGSGSEGSSRILGLAIQSDSPGVRETLERFCRAFGESPGVFLIDGPECLENARALLETCSPIERRHVQGAVVEADGAFDPWRAQPLESLLDRLETPWLPDLIRSESIRFEYQPIVAADTMALHAHEALVRGAAPYERHAPRALFAAAKAHGSLLALDQICCRYAIERGFPMLAEGESLFINFLPMTIYDPQVCLGATFAAARSADVDVSRIVFEVVESETFPEIDHLRSILDVYRSYGAKVALDDLGAGNTSLTCIDRLAPDYIKLDRELIETACRNEEPAMIAGLVAHARQLGIRVIAEGIETQEQLRFVLGLGVDYVQGWLIAAPAPEPVRRIDARAAA